MPNKKSFLNVIYRREKSVVVGLRIDPNLLARIDQISNNRSEFIRQAIEFYIKFIEISNDILDILRELGFV